MLPDNVTFPSTSSNAPCPACSSKDVRECYAVRDVPVHSCVLLGSASEARDFPRSDVLLVFCERCGLLFNAAFDPARIDYSHDYEETQGVSATFSSWLAAVVEGLVSDYGVRSKLVVEIGCGKGEFLASVCERGNNRGIGIDPAAAPERVDRDAGLGIELLAEEYAERHVRLGGDLVCCRHTLEHVAKVRAFADLLRRQLEQQTGSLVFIEVPDVLRQLREGAFWDIYYEHSVYFSPGSLARLFRGAGFQIERLELAYGDQYIHLVAGLGPSGSQELPLERDLDALEAGVESFRSQCADTIGQWARFFREAESARESVALWGSGSKATGFLTTLGAGDVVQGIVDINPRKHGRFSPGTGHPIVAPESLRGSRPDHVVIMNPIYVEEIRRSLSELGLSPRIHTL